MPDMVNSPPHYTDGRRFDVIDVIEDSVKFAPDPVLGGLQWQVLKYVLRCWSKDTPQENLQKAMWFLMRLIDQLRTKEDISKDGNG
jgi:hypothetical protein